MASFHRNLVKVRSDFRANARIEFHHPVAILGIDSRARILDFSIGGFFIETDQMALISNGQRLSLALRLPDEEAIKVIRVQVVHEEDMGFGCKIISRNHETIEALENCFLLFSEMLPID